MQQDTNIKGVLIMWMGLLSILIGSYLVGCLHGARVAQIISGVNLKEAGVKNFGASNATIVLGKKFGALVAVIDIAKGTLVILLTYMIAGQIGLSKEASSLIIFAAGAAVVIGHVFPFHMKFNGGKGTATIIGVLFGIDWRFGLLAFILFVLASLVTDFLVFGVLMLYITFFGISVWLAPGIWPPVIAAALFLIAVVKHIENFHRMKHGEESRVSTVFKKKRLV